MFRNVLYTQWIWSRWVLLILAAIALVLPAFTLASLGGTDLALVPEYETLNVMTNLGFGLMLLSCVSAGWIAVSAWSTDLQGEFVYALTRPVPRWYYLSLRLAAGVVLGLLVVAALLVGTLGTAAAMRLPDTLTAYPFALSLRYAMAQLVVYCAVFGFCALLKPRSQGSASLAWLMLGVALIAVVDALTGSYIADAFVRWLGSSWSPLGVLFGRWNLVDV